MWNLEKWYRWSYLQSRNRDRCREHGYQGGKKGWNELGHWDWYIYATDTMYKIDRASQVVLVNPPANASRRKRPGLDPWVRKIPWRGAWQPLQYFCLENSMDRGAWQAIVHRVTKSQTRLKWLSTQHTLLYGSTLISNLYMTTGETITLVYGPLLAKWCLCLDF